MHRDMLHDDYKVAYIEILTFVQRGGEVYITIIVEMIDLDNQDNGKCLR